MYPLLSITKPVPVAPPFLVEASIDTTEGMTRFAISATEPGARSMAFEVREIFIECQRVSPMRKRQILNQLVRQRRLEESHLSE